MACSDVTLQFGDGHVGAPAVFLYFELAGDDALVQSRAAHAQDAGGLGDVEPKVGQGISIVRHRRLSVVVGVFLNIPIFCRSQILRI